MGIYYKEVEEAIKNNEREIRHLQEELKGLRSVEKDTPRASYQRQEAQIRRHMATEESRLEGNKKLLSNYKLAQYSLQRLEELRRLRGEERNQQARREIDEEIAVRERELESSMGGLTDELRQELRDDFDNSTAKAKSSELDEMIETPEIGQEKGKEKVKKAGKAEEKTSAAIRDELIYRTHYENGMEYHEDDVETEEVDDRTTSEEEKTEEVVVDTSTVADIQTETDDATTDTEESDDATTSEEETEKDKMTSTEEIVITEAPIIDELQSDMASEEYINKRRARASAEYELAEEVYQAAIRRMQEIFQEEREEKERIGVISTERELDAFYDGYMQQKIRQNEIIEAAKKRRDSAQLSLRIIDAISSTFNQTYALPPHTGNKELPPHTRRTEIPQTEEYEVKIWENVPQPVYAPPKVQITEGPHTYVPEEYEVKTGENIPQPVYAPPKVQITEGPFTNTPEEYEVPIGENIPQPVYAPPNTTEITEVFEQVPQKKGLITIFDELTHGLILNPKDGKRYKASNIKVAKEFRDELNSGNYLYNLVHLVPAIAKLPIQLLRKISGKIMTSANAKRNAETLERRLNSLPPEELMTIYEEYRGNRVVQERYPTIMNTLIDERMQRFVLENITRINDELEQRYELSFAAIEELDRIDAALSVPEITDERRSELQSHRAEVLEGQASNIEAIREGYVEANGWLSGGINGFSEDIKATTTKLSVIGRIFGKEHKLDTQLLHQQALLEQKENAAIAAGDDEAALRAFIETETLLSDNTEISDGLFTRRSVGKKHYSPLAERLDNRDAQLEGNSVTDMVIEYTEAQRELAERERQAGK